jgi:acyl-CoA thioesterase I
MLSLIPVEFMQRLLPGFVLVALAVASCASARAAGGLACDLPTDLITPTDPLPHVAAAFTTNNRLEILALGSGSTVGDSSGAGGGPAMAYKAPQASFPYRMVEKLQAMRPSGHFQLTVKGGRDMTAEAMLPILRQELAAHHFDLVLWQTGTVEAVHGLRPDGLRDVLQDGVDVVAKAQADLVLIDTQFSRFLRANADIGPYETVLQEMTGNPDVTLFRRFDLTQLWVGSGQVDLERASRDQRDQTIALLHTCLGEALARYVVAGAGEP